MEQLLKILLIIWALTSLSLLTYVIIELVITKRSCKKLKNEIDEMKRLKATSPKINTEGSDFLEISNGRNVLRRTPQPESRGDCSEFELKEGPQQCGDCQTDGHYLCINCKHIASFEDMELSDNRERYYPKKYKEELQKVVGTMDGDKCNRDGCEGILEYTHPANCSCHINAPCSACVNINLSCPVCGWEEEKP